MTMSEDPDIVEIIIKMAQAEGLSADAAHQIEMMVRSNYGGQRVRIPKRKKYSNDDSRQEIRKDGLSSMPTAEITKKHKISRATLYRIIKKSPDEK